MGSKCSRNFTLGHPKLVTCSLSPHPWVPGVGPVGWMRCSAGQFSDLDGLVSSSPQGAPRGDSMCTGASWVRRPTWPPCTRMLRSSNPGSPHSTTSRPRQAALLIHQEDAPHPRGPAAFPTDPWTTWNPSPRPRRTYFNLLRPGLTWATKWEGVPLLCPTPCWPRPTPAVGTVGDGISSGGRESKPISQTCSPLQACSSLKPQQPGPEGGPSAALSSLWLHWRE